MRTHAINIANIAHISAVSNRLAFHVYGCASGRPVHIIASGPSAATYTPDPDAYVIVCNAAVQQYGHLADLHVMIEEMVWVFPWAKPTDAFRGRTVLDMGCARNIPDDLRDEVGAHWWNQAIWTRRQNYTDGQDLSVMGDGPVQVHSMFGGVGLCAIHIGCAANKMHTIHTWGMELHFPNGQQHFYGDRPYAPGNQLTSCVSFDIADGEPVIGDGPYTSTPFFIRASQAIRHVVQSSGVDLVDHGGGLLNPLEMHTCN